MAAPSAFTRVVAGRMAFLPQLRPDEVLLAAFALALVIVMAATGVWRAPDYRWPRLFQAALLLAAAVFVRAYRRARRDGRPRPLAVALVEMGQVARDFSTLLAILLLYETMHDLTPVLSPDVVDARLIAIDRAVLGVDASFWLGQYATPWLTRVMVLCYASYFVAPALLAAAMYWTGERSRFADVRLAIAITAALGYTGYLMVPAVGPYVFQADLFPTRLPGGGPETHLFIRAIDDMRGVARDCFPSLHTAQTTVVLALTWRFRRWLFWLYLPVAVGLYVSTIYLRMHYVIDVAAGFATAAVALALAPRINAGWARWEKDAARRVATG